MKLVFAVLFLGLVAAAPSMGCDSPFCFPPPAGGGGSISTPVSLANGGTGSALADPGADRLVFWDDSEGVIDWLTLGTNLSITGTTLDAAGGGMTIGNAVSGGSVSGGLLFQDSSFNLAQSTGVFYKTLTSNTPTLELLGGSATTTEAHLNLRQASTGDAFIRFIMGTANSWAVGVDNDDNDNLEFNTTSSSSSVLNQINPPFRLTTAGQASISSTLFLGNTSGVTGPSSRFQVMTDSSFSGGGGATLATYNATDATGPSLHFIKSDSNTMGTAAQTGVGNRLGTINFYGYNSSPVISLATVIRAKVAALDSGTPLGDLEIQISTSASGAVTAVYVSSGARTGLGVNNTTPTETLDVLGRAHFQGTAPAASSCGTSPAVVGSDVAGKVTIGTSASDTCTLTFATAWATAPACVVIGEDSAITLGATTSTTALTITAPGASDFSSDVLMYHCIGQDGN